MKPLVIFDLDGTLVDSRLDLANSTNEMLQTFGLGALPVDRVAAMVGDGVGKLVQRAFDASGLDAPLDEGIARFRTIYERRLLEHTRPYPGIPEAVAEAARGARLAVLTNKAEAPARRLLDAFDLGGVFGSVVGGDSGFPRKPDPAAIRYLMREASTSPETTLLVGDSAVDLETARRAGVGFCLARYGFGYLRGGLDLGPDDRVALDPSALGPVIREFAAASRCD